MSVMFLKQLGQHKCEAEMSVEHVHAIVNIKTLKGRLIAHKFNSGGTVGVVKSVKKKMSVAGQFAVKYQSETY